MKFPTAVNPDPRLRVVAALRRWPSQFFDVPAGVPKFGGIEPQRALQMLARPELFPWVRFDIDGTEHIPTTGPAIIVGNHRSYFDPLAIGFAMAQVGRPGALPRQEGGVRRPDRRPDHHRAGRHPRRAGHRAPTSRSPAAAEALAAGEVVALMPQGTIPRGPGLLRPRAQGPVGRGQAGRP